ncbi:flagellar biosynthetic protein FlhB [Povalibacter uvarum]|uniref:Flagellar biosynthetic protein FlhB n=1 Tax=Povalibacter uvarum TaxID=732238 RepID=A0A841HDK0_9GAMM|nr:EscU/YscU/HrcU family type III secretion system export apparatus switch protein [Povalibacter uvarum]MBB6091161.1 flagellar biosynthetic protein FlhB [Povalibacter uvarum]
MPQQSSDADANEPATPYKLEKARERGSIFRSAELTFAFVMLACVACVYGLGVRTLDATAAMLGRALQFASREQMSNVSALALSESLAGQMLSVLAPLVFCVWIAAFVVAAMQARGTFSSHPLKPDFTRVNPANGLKKLASLKTLHELWRSLAKLIVVGIATTLWGRHHLQDLLHLSAQASQPMSRSGLALLASVLALLAGIMLVFAALDWLINRSEFLRQMRMSRREIKDEHKHREGDPRIKARLRELRIEWFKRARQLSRVRTADVLLANPTHYAIALEYRQGEMPAPMITARGSGDLAQRMREEARRRTVPIVEHPSLARALFKLHDSQVFVPEEHFDQVARILRWVYAARGGQGRVA